MRRSNEVADRILAKTWDKKHTRSLGIGVARGGIDAGAGPGNRPHKTRSASGHRERPPPVTRICSPPRAKRTLSPNLSPQRIHDQYSHGQGGHDVALLNPNLYTYVHSYPTTYINYIVLSLSSLYSDAVDIILFSFINDVLIFFVLLFSSQTMKNLLNRKPTASFSNDSHNLPLDPSGQTILVEQPTAAFSLASSSAANRAPLHSHSKSPSKHQNHDANQSKKSTQMIYNEHFSGLEVRQLLE